MYASKVGVCLCKHVLILLMVKGELISSEHTVNPKLNEQLGLPPLHGDSYTGMSWSRTKSYFSYLRIGSVFRSPTLGCGASTCCFRGWGSSPRPVLCPLPLCRYSGSVSDGAGSWAGVRRPPSFPKLPNDLLGGLSKSFNSEICNKTFIKPRSSKEKH